MQNTSIMIGIPCLDSIKTETFTSLFMAAWKINYPAKLDIHKSCYVHDARNKIVENAIRAGASHLMFIDSDMQFPPDGINRLLEHDKDIVGGLYFRRQPPHFPTISQRQGDKLMTPSDYPKDRLFKVFGIATGFLLIKTEVFKNIPKPWFYFSHFHGKELGEDYYFCWRAGKKGYDVWCDPTIPIGHVGEYIYDTKDYEAYKKSWEKNQEAKFDGQL